jgi:tripartite-type tricarboxylate transporter receptor subunit TctC
MMGAESGVSAPPDGYTLTLISLSYTVNPALYRIKFDPIKDITPIIQISSGPLLVVTQHRTCCKQLRPIGAGVSISETPLKRMQ